MKTITIKADDKFDSALTKLAKKLETTKSGVIRAAVLHYKAQMEREALRQRMRDASLKTRLQSKRVVTDLDDANADGI
jgi:predicted transcriptional regulator